MKPAHRCRNLLPLFLALALLAGCDRDAGKAPGVGRVSQDLSIGRMRVSIWPEHDDPSLLVIYDGRFEDVSSYPVTTSFLVPAGSVISDACSLSHEGQHFCQLYKTRNQGEFDEVSLTLPYPNFYLSFHTPRFDAENENREFRYRLRTGHDVKTMEIDIQQPLRSTAFRITPAAGAVRSLQNESVSQLKGFTHFTYVMHDIEAGRESQFGLKYRKQDPKPSVDIKYVSMKESPARDSPYQTQKRIRTYIYVVFATGIVAALGLALRFLRSRRERRRGPRP